MSSGQRKRPGGALGSRRPQKRMRPTASTSARATEAELIELGASALEEALDLPGPSANPAVIHITLDDSDETDEEEAPAEVRGLSSEPSIPEVIDLTQYDSDESDAEAPAEVRGLLSEPSIPEVIDLSQDDSDEAYEDGNQRERGNSEPRGQQNSDIACPSRDDPDELRSDDVPPGTVRCVICMDFYSEIMQSRRQIVSTPCGHVFCSRCLYYCLMNSSLCPTCRADTDGQYHPLYI